MNEKKESNRCISCIQEADPVKGSASFKPQSTPRLAEDAELSSVYQYSAFSAKNLCDLCGFNGFWLFDRPKLIGLMAQFEWGSELLSMHSALPIF
jgi:hypothetical protein